MPFVPFQLCTIYSKLYYLFKNNLNKTVTWIQTNQGKNMHNPCRSATRYYEEEFEEVLAGARATRGWVPPHRKAAPCPKHPWSAWVCAPRWALAGPSQSR